MLVEHAEIVLVELPLRSVFLTSHGATERRSVVLVHLVGDGAEGWAEGAMGVTPGYTNEDAAGSVPMLRDTLLPAVVGKDLDDLRRLGGELAKLGGGPMVRAVVEMAAWDLVAHAKGVPLHRLFGSTRRAIGVSAGVGLALPDRVAERAEALAAEGYRQIKLKIARGYDLDIVRAARQALPDTDLAADANGAFTLADHRHLAELDELGLVFLEQPLPRDDLPGHAALAAALRTPLALDESVTDEETAAAAIGGGAAKALSLKAPRVGGYASALAIHDVAVGAGVDLFVGGLLDTGIGRAHALHLATLPGVTLPSELSSASRYWTRDIVLERLEAVDGTMEVPDGAGCGVTVDEEYLTGVVVHREAVGAAR
jgi:O-succinylbenzoate synthase